MVTAVDGVALHVAQHGEGADVLVLSGGPGLVNYLAVDGLTPEGSRAWLPDPRGVGRSGGGPHSMSQAVHDLEAIRTGVGVARWTVIGHSWGSDLAVRYALDHPGSVSRVVGIAGHGLHKDRSWSERYEAARSSEPELDIAWVEPVWRALQESFLEWIHEPGLFRKLAETQVPMQFVAAGEDIRPSWPLQQLAALVPRGTFETVDGVPHDFWSTHPSTWRDVVSRAIDR